VRETQQGGCDGGGTYPRGGGEKTFERGRNTPVDDRPQKTKRKRRGENVQRRAWSNNGVLQSGVGREGDLTLSGDKTAFGRCKTKRV